jgi:hypothetical protein
MNSQRYPQYTKDWTNILSERHKPFSSEALAWLREHKSKGMYHLHRSGTAVKFELKQDAEWFILRFL